MSMSDDTTAPVRVPNVGPGALSGLDHQVIGSNAGEAYEINQTLTGTAAPTNASDDNASDDTEPSDTGFDASAYTVDELNDYLDENPDAVEAAMASEAAGKGRQGVLHGRHGTPAAE